MKMYRAYKSSTLSEGIQTSTSKLIAHILYKLSYAHIEMHKWINMCKIIAMYWKYDMLIMWWLFRSTKRACETGEASWNFTRGWNWPIYEGYYYYLFSYHSHCFSYYVIIIRTEKRIFDLEWRNDLSIINHSTTLALAIPFQYCCSSSNIFSMNA